MDNSANKPHITKATSLPNINQLSHNFITPQPEFINAWIDQCKTKFTSLRLIHRDVLTEMGLTPPHSP